MVSNAVEEELACVGREIAELSSKLAAKSDQYAKLLALHLVTKASGM